MRIRRALAASLLGVTLVSTVPAAPSLGAGAANPKFLTLPFPRTYRMAIEAAWWRSKTEEHRGIDYVKGHPERPWTWEPFPVVAAAGGRACAGTWQSNACISGVGTHVVIRHRREGRTWYTYYGHLTTSTLTDRIPLNKDAYSVRVRRGEYLGMAGRTGYPGTGTHLHFELITLPFKDWDPYDLYALASRYPDPPGRNGKTCGANHFWMECPPRPEPPAAEQSATAGEQHRLSASGRTHQEAAARDARGPSRRRRRRRARGTGKPHQRPRAAMMRGADRRTS
jgi:murein DD-endopeptidase MepM/ murein hydrolase activator NlpD